MGTAGAIRTFLSAAFTDPKTGASTASLEDSHHALRVLDVLAPFKLIHVAFAEKQPKVITLEDADYDWLVKQFKEKAAQVFGITAAVHVKAVENLDKLEEPPKAKAEDNGSEEPKSRLRAVR